MGHIFGANPALPYEERSQILIHNGIALWDVCAAAQRPGSLDAAIVHSSVVPNDFGSFLAVHPDIEILCFNGCKAAEIFRRWVLPDLPGTRAIHYKTLPSTSPAHAAMSFEDKLARWETISRPR